MESSCCGQFAHYNSEGTQEQAAVEGCTGTQEGVRRPARVACSAAQHARAGGMHWGAGEVLLSTLFTEFTGD